jgi:hypothetical protein
MTALTRLPRQDTRRWRRGRRAGTTPSAVVAREGAGAMSPQSPSRGSGEEQGSACLGHRPGVADPMPNVGIALRAAVVKAIGNAALGPEGLPSDQAEDGEKEIGRHNEGTVRLVRSPPKLPTWSLKWGTERSLAGVFPYQAPGAVGVGPGGALAAVSGGRLGRAVVEADERAERGGVVVLVRRECRVDMGELPWVATVRGPSPPPTDRHSSPALLLLCPTLPRPFLSLYAGASAPGMAQPATSA